MLYNWIVSPFKNYIWWKKKTQISIFLGLEVIAFSPDLNISINRFLKFYNFPLFISWCLISISLSLISCCVASFSWYYLCSSQWALIVSGKFLIISLSQFCLPKIFTHYWYFNFVNYCDFNGDIFTFLLYCAKLHRNNYFTQL